MFLDFKVRIADTNSSRGAVVAASPDLNTNESYSLMPKKIVTSEHPSVQAFIGKKFNLLTAIKFLGKAERKHGGSQQLWEFKCDCGNVYTVLRTRVENGYCQSCGCLRVTSNKTHGFAPVGEKHPIYLKWLSMRSRCSNKKAQNYPYYGGRGITVCERWSEFSNFAADMLPGFVKGLTLGRKDNDGPYSPENCAWETVSQQGRNRRNNRLIEYKGQTHPMIKWCEILNISRAALKNRLHYGWSIERAFTTPVNPNYHRSYHNKP